MVEPVIALPGLQPDDGHETVERVLREVRGIVPVGQSTPPVARFPLVTSPLPGPPVLQLKVEVPSTEVPVTPLPTTHRPETES